MRIQRRTANALRKYGYARIAKSLGLSGRQTVYSWCLTLSIPDKHVDAVQEFTGLSIK